MRTITKCYALHKYNEHTSPLFKSLKILKLPELFNMQLNIFMYKYVRNELPSPLLNLYSINHDLHSHNTRNCHSVHLPNIKTDIVHRSFIHQSPLSWLGLPDNLKTANNAKMFNVKIKNHYLATY